MLSDLAVIGRGSSSTICVGDNDASRSHAEVHRLADGGYEIVDLGSRNGTFLNGEKISRAPLSFGDRVRVGGSVLLFSAHDPLSEQLLQRDRLETVGRLATGVAHDLNNALCVIKSMAALMLDEPRMDASGRAECLEDVLAASVRAERLTRRMVAFVRGHDEPANVIELRAVAEEAGLLARRLLPEEVALEIRVAPGLFVFGESTQLLQVFLNLVLNARDAILTARQSGQIRLLGFGEDGDVVAQVEEDGCGMSEQVKAHIFDPFFTTKGDRGSGIGLATAHEIVTNHGGRILVTSRPGGGTTFEVRLNAHDQGDRARRDTSPTETVAPLGIGQRVLVIDADIAARRATLRLLERTGYVVSEAETCIDAAERLGAADVVLLDLDQTTANLAAFAALDPKASGRPLLVTTTASDRESAAERVRALEPAALLPKPFTRAEILATLHRALSKAGLVDSDDTILNRRSR